MKYFVLTAILALFIVIPVHAVDLNISGNGEGSNNSVVIQQNNTNTVQQSNTANINNNVHSNANSGGNKVSGNGGPGSVTTGNAESNVNVNNNFNNNSAKIDPCCNKTTPPTPPTPPPDGGDNHPGPSNGSDNHDNSNGSSSSGSVLGLSNTAGSEPEQILFYVGGAACLALGATLRRNFAK